MTDEQQTELEERIAALEAREAELLRREAEAKGSPEQRQGRAILEAIERDTDHDLDLPWKRKGDQDA
jgi:hypothetical protein